MSKKRLRLEEFKKYIEFLDNTAALQGNVRFVGALHSLYDDGWLDWIYLYAKEQAERVQMLKKRVENERNIAGKAQNRADRVEKQNKRYREALEEIAESRITIADSSVTYVQQNEEEDNN